MELTQPAVQVSMTPLFYGRSSPSSWPTFCRASSSSRSRPYLAVPPSTGARARIRLVAMSTAQARPVSPVAPIGDNPAEQGTGADVVHVVAVVLAPADGNHGSAPRGGPSTAGRDQGRRARGRSSRSRHARRPVPSAAALPLPAAATVATDAADNKDSQLGGEEQADVAESGKGEAGVAAGEGPPPIVQCVMVRLGAHVKRDQGVLGRSGRRLAAGDEVGPRAADRVLDKVRQGRGQDQGDGEAEDRYMVLVRRRPREHVDQHHGEEGYEEGVNEVHSCKAEGRLGGPCQEGSEGAESGREPVRTTTYEQRLSRPRREDTRWPGC